MAIELTEEFKQGSACRFEVDLVDKLNAPLVIDVADMQAQVVTGTTVLADLTIATTAVAGTYLLTSAVDTSAWPEKTVYMDVYAIIDTFPAYSNTMGIPVVRRYTIPA